MNPIYIYDFLLRRNLKKNCNFFLFFLVSVVRSAAVERFSVSRMRTFFIALVYSACIAVSTVNSCLFTEEFTSLYIVNNAQMCAPCCQVTFRELVRRVSSSATQLCLSKSSYSCLKSTQFLIIKDQKVQPATVAYFQLLRRASVFDQDFLLMLFLIISWVFGRNVVQMHHMLI